MKKNGITLLVIQKKRKNVDFLYLDIPKTLVLRKNENTKVNEVIFPTLGFTGLNKRNRNHSFISYSNIVLQTIIRMMGF